MNAKLLLKIIESDYRFASFVKSFGDVANSRGIDLVYDGDNDEFVLFHKGKKLGRVKFEKDLIKVIVGNKVEIFKGEGVELVDRILRFVSRESLK